MGQCKGQTFFGEMIVFCRLDAGHSGKHENSDERMAWPNEKAPAVIDPERLTLAAAALPECIREFFAYVERTGCGVDPDWQTGVALDAVKLADATLAALRKGEE